MTDRERARNASGRKAGDEAVALRRLPYPYRAMLSICSDLDDTTDRRRYLEIVRFLNTTEMTPMGPGVGLEVGNSIYFDMPPGMFSYWNTDDAGRAMIRTLIKSGHVDCLHSYGDLATIRAHAARALDELAGHGCRLKVWVDHSAAPTNFGPDIMRGSGDVPGHQAYHADLTIGHGIRFVWLGRVTSIVGQDVPPRLGGTWMGRHPIASAVTTVKEAAKRFLARRGNAKYAMHVTNNVLRRTALRDGASVREFIRCNPHWGGVSSGETAGGIGQVLSNEMLSRLISREGVCILDTHLGKRPGPDGALGDDAVAGLRRLAEAANAGRILVTTTSRALEYLTARDCIEWSAGRRGDQLDIDVRADENAAQAGAPGGCDDLAGLTFYVPDGCECRVAVNGTRRNDLRANPPDSTGRPSVMLPWPKLRLPEM